MDGFECLRRARERSPELRIVAFSIHHDPFHLSAAATAGADAISKAAGAVRTRTVKVVLASQVKRSGCSQGAQGLPHAALVDGAQLEVHLVARGYTNVQIAQRLWVTKWTVKFHLANAYRKLGVSTAPRQRGTCSTMVSRTCRSTARREQLGEEGAQLRRQARGFRTLHHTSTP